MENKEKIVCPVCKGSGTIHPPVDNQQILNKEKMVKILHKEGYSTRVIMKMLDYKSPNSITYILNKANDK